MGFQTTVNVELGFGVPGALYDDSPVRSSVYELISSSAAYNIVGATAYTFSSADPGTGAASAQAAAGGAATAQFVGILANAKVYATSGPSGSALNPTMTLPNHTIAELVTMGHLIVSLPGPANVGDQVCYDQTTGSLSTFVKTTTFTASLLSTGVLSVTALTAGQLQVGMLVSGASVPGGIYITGDTTGTGDTGTYTTNYTGTTIAAEAMSAPSLPPSAAAFTAAILTTGILSVSAVTAGQLAVGQVVYGTGLTPNPVITAYGTGIGGTGTYSINTTTAVSAAALTTDQQVQILRAEVIKFQPQGGLGGLGVISLSNQ